jgi:5-methylcytosine-specific restriction enzyme A
MSWGFEEEKVYNRRADIHGRFGGQQQGGIITPSQYPVVILITGEEGLTHGYADRLRDDGVFEYFGEGQVGDMTLQRGNLAIVSHSAEGKGLLLFRKANGGLRFLGEMVYENHQIKMAADRDGNQRNAIVFELRRLNAVFERMEEDVATPAPNTTLDQLRALALASTNNSEAGTSSTTRTVFQRSQDVRRYVLARSSGNCEGCHSPAPFVRRDGSPYLEPHHIRRLSDGGPDNPAFVIALCPNCHRRVHAGADGQVFNTNLMVSMAQIEPQ